MSLKDAKLCSGASTWNTRLSQIGKTEKKIIIVTYSLPKAKYIKDILEKQPKNVTLIYHEKFYSRAKAIKEYCPQIKLIPKPNVHAKMVLIEPRGVWLSSANFGESGWFEHTIGIHSEEAYEYYYKSLCEYVGYQI